MSKAHLIVAILIPIAVVLAAVIIFIFIHTHKQHVMKKKIESLQEGFSSEIMTDIKLTLDRVYAVAESNARFKSAAKNLDVVYDKIDGRNSRQESLVIELNDMINTSRKREKGVKRAKRLSLVEYKKRVSTIEELHIQLNKLTVEFRDIAAQVTQQDEYIQTDFHFYQKQLRKINEVYGQKRVLLDRMADQIEILRDKIKDVEKEFHNVVVNLDLDLADKLLRQYIKYTQKYAQVISEGPAIQAHLFVQIPEIVKRLNETYLAKKKDLNTSFDQIDYKNSMEKIAERFQEAKKELSVLNIDKCKELIRSILKSIKVLERLINFEIKARNVFVTSYEDVIEEVKKSLENYVNIKKQLKEVSGSGKQIPVETIEKFEEIRTKGQEVDSQALKFRELMHDKDTSYSSKLSRMKILINSSIELNKLINELIEMLWSLNIENSITKNKFKRAEAALNEVIANVKKENIKMSENDKNEFEFISKEITYLSKLISHENIAKEVVERVDVISKRVSQFYSAISGNIQIGKHVKNMILELAPKRALDDKLHIQLQLVERLFLEGEYAQALNFIIDYLEGRKK